VGLGLRVSKGIVQKHEGGIAVRSSTDAGRSGAVFLLFFPTCWNWSHNRFRVRAPLHNLVKRAVHALGRGLIPSVKPSSSPTLTTRCAN
jgi:hypothetical protein